MRDLVTNRKARHDYVIEQKFEAGLVLLGSEVKSLRAGNANLQEAFVRVDGTEVWMVGCHISPYAQANRESHLPLRPRKLLLRKAEIAKLRRAVQQKGKSIVPLRLYINGSRIKVEIALGTGKKTYDKRRALKERDQKRDLERG